MMATIPPMSIHIALSVGEPVKNRETSELNDFVAATPKTTRTIPPARIASEISLFIEKTSFSFSFLTQLFSLSSADNDIRGQAKHTSLFSGNSAGAGLNTNTGGFRGCQIPV
jgi:hypothetical protein